MPGTAVSLLAAACIVLAAAGAGAEPVEVVRNNGPDQNRINVAILGDGYTSEDLAQYAIDMNLLLAELFGDRPFADYASYFNVRRVDVTSHESGADHPAQNVYRDTALGARYDCLDIARLVCVDHGAVLDVLDRSVPATARDIVIVLVNDDAFGGSGGRFPVTSTNRSSAQILLHEIGHSFGLLADEYTGGGPACVDSVEPPEVNVTRESTAAAIKWSYWIEPGTPVPATDSRPGVVSAYEGAKYCESGLYRPTFASKMRALGKPFEQVNTEQLIRRIYNLVSPIDAVSPTTVELRSEECESLEFSVKTPGEPGGLPGTLETTWRIGGAVAARGSSLTVAGCLLSTGSHGIEVEVRDVTTAVRRDPDEALVERFRWNLEISLTAEQLERYRATWRILRGGNEPATSAGTTTSFTDDPIHPGTTLVKAVHFQELRARIAALRAREGLPVVQWTDSTLVAGVTPVRREHLTELRAALDAVYAALDRPPPSYTDPAATAGATAIEAVHLMELRSAVLALE